MRGTRKESNPVTVDARWLSTGIGTYTFNVLSRLKACGDIYLRALTLPQHRAKLEPFCDRIDIVDAGIYTMREQIQIPIAAKSSTVFHAPHYNAPLLYSGALLVSILDLTHILDETFRRTLKSRLYARPMFHLVARKAAHIFTLSEYSKRQIHQTLGVPNEKITVTYCGVSPQFKPLDRASALRIVQWELGLNSRYVLYVGNLKPHKNVPTLLRAYAELRTDDHIEQKLLIVGNDPVGLPRLQALARDLGLQDSVAFVPYVSDELLPMVYAAADLLVFPSLEEGFGLPIIEAMACGTPVVCSDAASMPEVAGDAAVMFDPKNGDALAHAIATVLSSPEMHACLRAKGFVQAKRFDWRDCAMRHYQVYREYFPV
jgi:glycosyltransferase involved in cell wall biosynthesis